MAESVDRLAERMREQAGQYARHGARVWALERIRVQMNTTDPTEDLRPFLENLFAALDMVEAEERGKSFPGLSGPGGPVGGQ